MKMCYLDLDCVGSSLRREAQTPLATSSSSSGGLGGGDESWGFLPLGHAWNTSPRRCPNKLNWVISMWRSSGSQMTELLTMSLRESLATLSFLLLVSKTSFFQPRPTARDHRWGKECRLTFKSTSPFRLRIMVSDLELLILCFTLFNSTYFFLFHCVTLGRT